MIRPVALLFSLLFLIAGCESRKLELLNADGSAWQDYRGRWVVINYWAEWCKPCREEMPELNQLHRLYVRDVAVLGVHYDRPDAEQLSREVETMGVRFPVLMRDPAQRLGYERPSVLPTTLIFDAEGELQHTLVGPQKLELLRGVLKLSPVLAEEDSG